MLLHHDNMLLLQDTGNYNITRLIDCSVQSVWNIQSLISAPA